jgi:hypothetical protein
MAEDHLAVTGQAQVGFKHPHPRLIPLQKSLQTVQRRAALGPYFIHSAHTVRDDPGPSQNVRCRESLAGDRSVRDGIFRFRRFSGGWVRLTAPGRLQPGPPQFYPGLPQHVFQLRDVAVFQKNPCGQEQESSGKEDENGWQIL